MTTETHTQADSRAAATPPSAEGMAAVIALAAVLGAALLYLGSMTFTLVHYRHWPAPAGFLSALLMAAIALVIATLRLLMEWEFTASLLPMGVLWVTGAVLAGLQGAASLMGTGTVPMSMLIGIVAAVGMVGFTELAADQS
ncbi:hypothetical protein E6W39_00995 [Kitasatospora acidiphila]|uniref:Uncharacterized protein n=1 Tax=Kitasatospora acidiphila TaxID=2567942 RepID=A0A540WHM9_9ACTN|nr:hypothetical protein [Kitasatospora acidiphila]TQF07944.1 hypothetical protein E6W39_00995 [Kitasatospora acidiphila]